MINITKKTWIVFTLLALIGALTWLWLTIPQLTLVDLSVKREEAIKVATDFLKSSDIDISEYKKSTVFRFNESPSLYLQRNITMEGLSEFIKTYDFDMFLWIVRFFKEGQKKAYTVAVSSKTGKVTGYAYDIDEDVTAPPITKEEARTKAIQILKQQFNFDFSEYKLVADSKISWDNRDDYDFTWENKNVSIPWDKESTTTAKLTQGIKLNSNEVIRLRINELKIPEGFTRSVEHQQDVGSNLTTIFSLINFVLFTISIFYLVTRKNQLAMSKSKKFYILVTATLFIIMVLSYLNQQENILQNYPTSIDFEGYMLRSLFSFVFGAFMICVTLIIPSLSGESLYNQNTENNKIGSFLYFLRTSFLTRNVAKMIILGYLVCIISLGVQAFIIHLGQTYLGVWVKHNWLNTLSTAYFPFIATLIIALKSSLSEELFYRLFTINWMKVTFKSTIAAAIVSSIIWGFSHSHYPVYPMWFRGIEVSLLGFFVAFIYLRYGLITVITTHFVFNAFWSSTGYLFGRSTPFDFYTSLAICLLPLGFAVTAYLANRPEEERPLRWQLNKHQQFNASLLNEYLNAHWSEYQNYTDQEIIDAITAHGWDTAVVEETLKEIKDQKSG